MVVVVMSLVSATLLLIVEQSANYVTSRMRKSGTHHCADEDLFGTCRGLGL